MDRWAYAPTREQSQYAAGRPAASTGSWFPQAAPADGLGGFPPVQPWSQQANAGNNNPYQVYHERDRAAATLVPSASVQLAYPQQAEPRGYTTQLYGGPAQYGDGARDALHPSAVAGVVPALSSAVHGAGQYQQPALSRSFPAPQPWAGGLLREQAPSAVPYPQVGGQTQNVPAGRRTPPKFQYRMAEQVPLSIGASSASFLKPPVGLFSQKDLTDHYYRSYMGVEKAEPAANQFRVPVAHSSSLPTAGGVSGHQRSHSYPDRSWNKREETMSSRMFDRDRDTGGLTRGGRDKPPSASRAVGSTPQGSGGTLPNRFANLGSLFQQQSGIPVSRVNKTGQSTVTTASRFSEPRTTWSHSGGLKSARVAATDSRTAGPHSSTHSRPWNQREVEGPNTLPHKRPQSSRGPPLPGRLGVTSPTSRSFVSPAKTTASSSSVDSRPGSAPGPAPTQDITAVAAKIVSTLRQKRQLQQEASPIMGVVKKPKREPSDAVEGFSFNLSSASRDSKPLCPPTTTPSNATPVQATPSNAPPVQATPPKASTPVSTTPEQSELQETLIRCKLCGTVVPNQFHFDAHLKSEAHLAKVKQLPKQGGGSAASKTSKNIPVEAAPSQGSSVTSQHARQKPSGSSSSSLTKVAPKVSTGGDFSRGQGARDSPKTTSDKPPTSHLLRPPTSVPQRSNSGPSPQPALKTTTTFTSPSASSSSSPSTSSTSTSSSSSSSTLSKTQFCRPCNLRVGESSHWEAHLCSAYHKAAVDGSARGKAPAPSRCLIRFLCGVCETGTYDEQGFRDHLAGKKHIKNQTLAARTEALAKLAGSTVSGPGGVTKEAETTAKVPPKSSVPSKPGQAAVKVVSGKTVSPAKQQSHAAPSPRGKVPSAPAQSSNRQTESVDSPPPPHLPSVSILSHAKKSLSQTKSALSQSLAAVVGLTGAEAKASATSPSRKILLEKAAFLLKQIGGEHAQQAAGQEDATGGARGAPSTAVGEGVDAGNTGVKVTSSAGAKMMPSPKTKPTPSVKVKPTPITMDKTEPQPPSSGQPPRKSEPVKKTTTQAKSTAADAIARAPPILGSLRLVAKAESTVAATPPAKPATPAPASDPTVVGVAATGDPGLTEVKSKMAASGDALKKKKRVIIVRKRGSPPNNEIEEAGTEKTPEKRPRESPPGEVVSVKLSPPPAQSEVAHSPDLAQPTPKAVPDSTVPSKTTSKASSLVAHPESRTVVTKRIVTIKKPSPEKPSNADSLLTCQRVSPIETTPTRVSSPDSTAAVMSGSHTEPSRSGSAAGGEIEEELEILVHPEFDGYELEATERSERRVVMQEVGGAKPGGKQDGKTPGEAETGRREGRAGGGGASSERRDRGRGGSRAGQPRGNSRAIFSSSFRRAVLARRRVTDPDRPDMRPPHPRPLTPPPLSRPRPRLPWPDLPRPLDPLRPPSPPRPLRPYPVEERLPRPLGPPLSLRDRLGPPRPHTRTHPAFSAGRRLDDHPLFEPRPLRLDDVPLDRPRPYPSRPVWSREPPLHRGYPL